MPPRRDGPAHPIRRPVMFQSWTGISFLHWRYAAHEIRSLLPPELSLDTFDSSAWIGLTPFVLDNLRPPLISPLPWISRFPEVNVRTYVVGPDGEPGIWFFSLEAHRLAAVIGARLTYGLPYRWSRIRVSHAEDVVRYQCRRHYPFRSAGCDIHIRIGPPVAAGEFERFLTARFRLYTSLGGRLAFADVDHPPWPLHAADVIDLEQNLLEQSGVPRPQGLPVAHYSPGVHVSVARPHWAPRRSLALACEYQA